MVVSARSFDIGKAIEAILFVATKLADPTFHSVSKVLKVPVGRGWVSPDQAELIQLAFDVSNGCRIQTKRQPELRQLSESEIECLTDSIAEYGRKTFGELTTLSHDAAWNSADENEPISIEEIAKTLPNSELLIAHLRA